MTHPWRLWLAASLIALMAALTLQDVRAQPAEKERAEVPTAPAVTIGNVRYEAPLWTRMRGLPQNGGYVAAIDASSGTELWIAKVYDSLPTDGREADKGDVFITSLRPDRHGKVLWVTDERGRRWRLDLKMRRAKAAGVR